jgi:hypothetical protein
MRRPSTARRSTSVHCGAYRPPGSIVIARRQEDSGGSALRAAPHRMRPAVRLPRWSALRADRFGSDGEPDYVPQRDGTQSKFRLPVRSASRTRSSNRGVISGRDWSGSSLGYSLQDSSFLSTIIHGAQAIRLDGRKKETPRGCRHNGRGSGGHMATVVLCCAPAVLTYWRGRFCRCCGVSIVLEKMIVGCGRRDPCRHCGKLTCGPHSHDGSGGWAVRRFCELCGEECDRGTCPTHGMTQA